MDSRDQATCPICGWPVHRLELEQHYDACHPRSEAYLNELAGYLGALADEATATLAGLIDRRPLDDTQLNRLAGKVRDLIMRVGVYRKMELESLPTPSGCAHCGDDRRSHYSQWVPGEIGYHVWQEPSQHQILQRMKIRRGIRQLRKAKKDE